MVRRPRAIRLFLTAVGALAMTLGAATTSLPASAETTLLSLGSSEEQTDGLSYWPSVSADGRFVALIHRP